MLMFMNIIILGYSSPRIKKSCNSDLFLRIVSYKLIIVRKKSQNCEMKVAGFHKALLGEK